MSYGPSSIFALLRGNRERRPIPASNRVIDVPGVKLSDINIEVFEHDRTILRRISGGRKVHKTEEDETVSIDSETIFEKSFYVGSQYY
jgi:hypothetical protein